MATAFVRLLSGNLCTCFRVAVRYNGLQNFCPFEHKKTSKSSLYFGLISREASKVYTYAHFITIIKCAVPYKEGFYQILFYIVFKFGH